MSERRDRHSALNARDDILAIADLWPELVARLTVGGGSDRSGVLTPPGPKVPINAHVSDVIADVTQWVNFLARVLTDETDWTPPATLDVPTLCRDIARNRVGHFTESPDEMFVLAFYDDVSEKVGAVEKAARPSGVRTVRLGIACQGDGITPCDGQYTVRMDPEKPGLLPDMVCNHDRAHRITPEQWQRSMRKSAMDPKRAAELVARIRGAA